jgi:hypothetical protein
MFNAYLRSITFFHLYSMCQIPTLSFFNRLAFCGPQALEDTSLT